MIQILVLQHPTLGECARQVITYANPKYKIEYDWSKKYGKKYSECHVILEEGNMRVVVNNDGLDLPKEKLIKNIITGEIYKDRIEASMDTGLSLTIVYRHLHRKNKPGFKYLLKWA